MQESSLTKMAYHTHILEDFKSNRNTLINKSQQFKTFIDNSCPRAEHCEKLIVSKRNLTEKINIDHKSHLKDNTYVIFVHENQFTNYIKEKLRCRTWKIKTLLCNDSSLCNELRHEYTEPTETGLKYTHVHVCKELTHTDIQVNGQNVRKPTRTFNSVQIGEDDQYCRIQVSKRNVTDNENLELAHVHVTVSPNFKFTKVEYCNNTHIQSLDVPVYEQEDKGYLKILENLRYMHLPECENFNSTHVHISEHREHTHVQVCENMVQLLNYCFFENELIVPRGHIINRTPVQETDKLYVLVDGCNVGYYNKDSQTDSDGFISNIYECIKYLKRMINEWNTDVTINIIMQRWRKETRDLFERQCSDFLPKENIQWVFTSNEGKSQDDRYILEMAKGRNALIVSNDNFDDLAHEKNRAWKHVIDNRLMKYQITASDEELDENNKLTYKKFELNEISENIFMHYLKVGSQQPAVTEDSGFIEQFNKKNKKYYVSGYTNETTEEEIIKYVQIRGIRLKTIAKFSSPGKVSVHLTVIRTQNCDLLLKSEFWPRGIKCKIWHHEKGPFKNPR